ncbi:MAG: translation initiation factor Sui1 [Caldimonas sp.]
MRKSTEAGGLVYSTEGGRMCPACRKPLAACICAAAAPARKGDGVVRISRETSGRAGKTVTVVRGLDLDEEALAALGKRLRAACGTGGTAKDGVLELQGDHREVVAKLLGQAGDTVQHAGG